MTQDVTMPICSHEKTKRLEVDIDTYYQILLNKKNNITGVIARHSNRKQGDTFKTSIICNTLFNLSIVAYLASWLL